MSYQFIPRNLSNKIHDLFASNIQGIYYNFNRRHKQVTGEFPQLPPPRHPSSPLPEDPTLSKTVRLPVTAPLKQTSTTGSMRKIAATHVFTMNRDIDNRIWAMQQQPQIIRLHSETYKILAFLGHISPDGYRHTTRDGKHRQEIPVERDDRLPINDFRLEY